MGHRSITSKFVTPTTPSINDRTVGVTNLGVMLLWYGHTQNDPWVMITCDAANDDKVVLTNTLRILGVECTGGYLTVYTVASQWRNYFLVIPEVKLIKFYPTAKELKEFVFLTAVQHNPYIQVSHLLWIRYRFDTKCFDRNGEIDGSVQQRRNSTAYAPELRLSCTNPLK